MRIMIYLDNAATTMPKPDAVPAAVAKAIQALGNPARGAHGASLAALRTVLQTRGELAALFGAQEPFQVVLCPNATAALNIAIGGLDGHIVTTAAEHNSVLRPVYRRGNYSIVPVDAKGRLNLEQLEAAIRPDTAGVVVTHASNLTGNVYDIRSIGEICHRKGVHLVVDAAQTAGLLNPSMQWKGVSAIAFSGHKSLYGPQGTGGLCLAPGFMPPPLVVGGSGFDSFSKSHPTHLPDALEAGTQNAHSAAGLLAGVQYVKSQGGACFTAADALARDFVQKLKKLQGVLFYGDIDAAVRTPVVALGLQGMDSAELAQQLDEDYGIATRAGAHCAPLMHAALGTGHSGAVRFSFSHFNTRADMEAAVQALEEISRAGRASG